MSLARVKHPAEANDAVRGEVDWLGRARANPSDEGKKGTSYFPPSAELRSSDWRSTASFHWSGSL